MMVPRTKATITLSDIELVVVEAKARTNDDTELEEREYMEKNGIAPFEEFTLSTYMMTTWRRWSELMPNKNHRNQILHHMAVTGINKCLYSVSDKNGNILRVVAVTCIGPILDKYLNIMKMLYKSHLSHLYESTEAELKLYLINLELDHKNDFGFAADGFTVFQSWRKVKALDDYCRDRYNRERAPPSLAMHVMPRIVAMWNRNKNSIDVCSRLLSHVQPGIFSGSPQILLFTRTMLCGIQNLMRVKQVRIYFIAEAKQLKLPQINRVLEDVKSKKIHTITELNVQRSKVAKMKDGVVEVIAYLQKFKEQGEFQSSEASVAVTQKPKHIFEKAQQPGNKYHSIRFDNSLEAPHLPVDLSPGTCKVCCHECAKRSLDEPSTLVEHKRIGPRVKTGCKRCQVNLCTKFYRFPVEFPQQTCFDIFHTLEQFPSFCKDTNKVLPRYVTIRQHRKSLNVQKRRGSLVSSQPSRARSRSLSARPLSSANEQAAVDALQTLAPATPARSAASTKRTSDATLSEIAPRAHKKRTGRSSQDELL